MNLDTPAVPVHTARLQAFLIEKGWMEATAEAPADEAEPDSEEPVMNIGCPLSEMTVLSMTNLIHMLYSKQYILAKSVREGRIAITAEAISELHERNPLTVEEFCDFIRGYTLRGHIKGIQVSDEVISISFPLTEDDAARAAFQQLAVSFFNFAKAAKRVQPDFQKPEAEKYHMRGWLLRLGFGGPANATARKVLLDHLAGCSAFPNRPSVTPTSTRQFAVSSARPHVRRQKPRSRPRPRFRNRCPKLKTSPQTPL